MPFYVGIDYSMTCPAITILPVASVQSLDTCRIGYLSKKKPNQVHPYIFPYQMEAYEHDTERFDMIAEWAVQFISEKTWGDVYIYIEDYAFAAKGKVFQIGENGGMLKHKLWEAGYKFTSIAPTVIKKFATGSGAAKKEQMYDAFMRLTGVNYLKRLLQPKKVKIDSPLSDVVDSFYICAYAKEHVGLEVDVDVKWDSSTTILPPNNFKVRMPKGAAVPKSKKAEIVLI
jgi:Holliday junction resolvasome RuvABC endonuclease subunit